MHLEFKEPEFRISPPGRCNWCGKFTIEYGKVYCSKSCSRTFRHWWVAEIPLWKRTVYIWDNFTCRDCGLHPLTTNEHGLSIPDLSQLSIDHIVPVARGGKTEWDNLQVLCRRCNYQKNKWAVGESHQRIKEEDETQVWLNAISSHAAKLGQ